MQCAQKLLSEFDGADSRRLFEIVTGGETWVRYCEPLSKEANKVWLPKRANPPMIPQHGFRAPKVMYCIFFDSHGPVCQICVPKNQTITGSFYINQCLAEVENTTIINDQRSELEDYEAGFACSFVVHFVSALEPLALGIGINYVRFDTMKELNNNQIFHCICEDSCIHLAGEKSAP